ncbi:AAA family ATPase [Lachnoclostridium sp. MSJ-17]|uniref:AAA family ATPase n=1 Tax=Lachnoclostridium sp. MSJ-17 TaxID=2841516 RepID=UPI001C11C4BC|nr:ATP-binding protein [Lachnoclostridium sp. MSJ-17]MBU5462757.1 ATP-binding protein [Lachnoclostridium sp. MSJ-17]
MLIGFSVSNYKSFLEQQSISLLASRISRHKNHVAEIANKKVLKSSLIFGANAGGKSNFIRAVSFSRNIILFGLNGTDTSKKYFRIKQNANKIPGVFEYRLIANNTEYSYGFAFSYITKEFLSEWLVKISNDTETVLYDRSIDENGNSIISSDVIDNDDESTLRLKLYLEDFGNGISDTLKKKTILSDIAQRSSIQSGVIKEIIDVYKWFQDLIVIFPQSKYANLGSIVEDHDSKDSFSNYLLNFDTGIESIESQLMEFDLDKLLSDIPKEKADQIENEIANRVTYSPVTLKINDQRFVLKQNENGEIVYSKMLLNHGNADDLFEYSDESDGTQRLFDLIPIFFALKQNRVILIDEIDRSLHTNLTRKFIELFFSVSRNNSSQLIATTHDSNLLDLDLLRQDEIWFVKREKDHSSNIYSLNLYKERFDKRIEKEYLIGRYGATPNLEKLDAFEEVIDDE